MTRPVFVVAALCLSAPASADVLHAIREQPLFEVSHSVDVRLANGVATYKVRRQFANPGKLADEAGLAIDLPYGAAATGLRIRAHGVWYDGELMEREKAAALYHELTGLGAYKPKDPALLQWQWADKLYLQVFPVMPGGVSTVEYTLTVPTRYANGRYWLSYPRTNTGASEAADRDGATLRLATPIVTIHPAWGDAMTPITIDNQRVAADTPVVLLPPVREPWADAVDPDPSASYVASRIEIPASSHTQHPFATAKLQIDIKHTYKSDLRVDLVTPAGKRVPIFEGSGGDANDVKGAFTAKLPPGTVGAGTWRLVVSDHAALDTGSLDAWSLTLGEAKDGTTVAATDTPVFVPDAPENASDAGVASISIVPPPIDTWLARLGRVVASDAHAFARLEVDVAPEVRPAPKRAQVVFVVDASRSITEEGLAAELDAIRAYLTFVPDADVELVAYRRHATRVFGRFVGAKDVEAALAAAKQHAAFALGNGSALDDGAKLAATILADRNAGPRRVVLVTDRLLRTTLSDTAALAALAALSPATVVHVVVPQLDHDDRATLQRVDADKLAPLATKHHGIFVELGGLPAHTIKDLAPAVVELVRPTRIDNLAVDGLKVDDKLLREGEGLRIMLGQKTAPTRVVLTGKLWSDPVRREVVVDPAFSIATAGFVFGGDEHHELSHDEMMRVAMMGRAVSPVTSYVAFEPGTRPSTIGLDELRGSAGFGSGNGAGYGGGVGMVRRPPDLHGLIDANACEKTAKPPKGWHVMLTIETTKDEIVDVTIATGAGAMATCLAEAYWPVKLDPAVFYEERQSYDVQFGDL
jgi:subtilisin-like proprotein convertase family protein